MLTINFEELGLKLKNEVKTFAYEGVIIEVDQYLPDEEKRAIVEITMQKALQDDGIYNPILVNRYFHLNIVYKYTNITFTPTDREDEGKLYDLLVTSGILDNILKLIPDEEYNTVYNYLNEYIDDTMQYTTTAASVLRAAILNMPQNAEKAMEMFKNFDVGQLKELVELANTLKQEGFNPFN